MVKKVKKEVTVKKTYIFPVGTLLCKCNPRRTFPFKAMKMVISFIIYCTYELMWRLLK